MKKTQKIHKNLLFLGGSLLLGSGLALYQLNQINKTLGTEIIDFSIQSMKKELAQDNQTYNKDNLLHYFIEDVSNQLQMIQKRGEVYFSRLFYAGRYEIICNQVNKLVINPSLSTYQREKIFEFLDILEQFKERKEFNNKLALQMSNIQKKNAQIKSQNKLLLDSFYELQLQLLTTHVFGLTQQSKGKIDILYSYFKQREQYMSTIFDKSTKEDINQSTQSDNANETWVDQVNYGFKIQYI